MRLPTNLLNAIVTRRDTKVVVRESTLAPDAQAEVAQLAARVHGRVSKRYADRDGSKKVIAWVARGVSEPDFNKFRTAFIKDPVDSLAMFLATCTRHDFDTGDFEKLKPLLHSFAGTPEVREELLCQVMSHDVTANLLKTATTRPGPVRVSLLMKRSILVRMLQRGIAPTNRDAVRKTDRAVAAFQSVRSTQLTNTQLMLDIGFMRLPSERREQILGLLAEMWTPQKPKMTALVTDLSLRFNSRNAQFLQRMLWPMPDAIPNSASRREELAQAIHDNVHSTWNGDVWEEFLNRWLTLPTTGPLMARLESEVQRLAALHKRVAWPAGIL